MNRKASLQALTGGPPKTPGSRMAADSELGVGDLVNVPGEMYGTVKFVGSVRGKNGRFVGVELDERFASKGKNDGDVDGTHYFTTNIPGAGIFLPVHRAEKRASPMIEEEDTFPPTPNTPSYSTMNGSRTRGNGYTPPTPAVPPKFSQSVGPGARPSSPQFKPKRPSLPRPESPLRKQPELRPTPSRNLSQSVRGGRPNLGASTTSPPKSSFRATTTSRTTGAATPRPYSRTGSRLGTRGRGDDEDGTPVGVASNASKSRTTSQSSVPSYSQPMRSPSRLGSAGGQDHEVQRLKKELAERDRQLVEQAQTLSEMETSVKELSALMPGDGLTPGGSRRGGELGEDDYDDQNTAQLRQLLREKNEKIALMTSDFDNHRADFRSTLDSLEMASTETERVYEEQKRDLLAQVSELQQRNEELHAEVEMGANNNKDDFEGVAQQLKQLEELVAELEEGLEESRRGEAEARGEVEFLRGEVERGRSELAREKEKLVSLTKGGGANAKELDNKEDEIRGLKAIIHNLSSSSSSASPNGHQHGEDAEELKRLQDALEQVRLEKDGLEEELEHVRRDFATTNGHGHARNESEQTATGLENGTPGRQRSETVKATFAERARQNAIADDRDGEDTAEAEAAEGSEGVYCEMCQSKDHDTVECDSLSATSPAPSSEQRRASSPEPAPAAASSRESLSPGKENASAAKGGKAADEDKWCALCEKDGHLAFDCPEEQY